MEDDTIFAMATALGRAGVAIVRISGAQAGAALMALSRQLLPPPRRARLVRLMAPEDGELLDQSLVLWFPAPGSFTGEDVVELHLHGGRAVVAGVLESIGRMAGLRPAEAGEFTRRAFEHGRMDLTAAEALADLVAAETAVQRRQALRQMDGALTRLYDGWRVVLVRLLAHLEAVIDFPEEDLPAALIAEIYLGVGGLAAEILHHLNDGRRGERLREGFQVAIIGPPNAGKSSLLNRIAGREAAIVSATAGTTRDVVEVHLDLGGYPVTVADTAGVREADGDIEREGVRRALARAEDADVRLVVLDGGTWPRLEAEIAALIDETSIVVMNKFDLYRGETPILVAGKTAIAVSATLGQGLDLLLDAIMEQVTARVSDSGEPALTRVRHRVALESCEAALRRALLAPLPELMAEDMRLAGRALGRITGRVAVDEILDVIFGEFCIGK